MGFSEQVYDLTPIFFFAYHRPAFCLGEHTLSVPMTLFATNRQNLCRRLKANPQVPAGAVVLLQGGSQEMRYCSDHEPLFRQVTIVKTEN